MRWLRLIYNAIHATLWAFLAAGSTMLAWATFHNPKLDAAAETRLVDEIFEENHRYCTKWGFEIGTHEYNLCQLDLNELRAREDERRSLW